MPHIICPNCNHEIKERTFMLHWLKGETYYDKPTKIQGYDIEDAFRKAGFGRGAISAIDFWQEIFDDEEDDRPERKQFP
jgi:hypothetical protein